MALMSNRSWNEWIGEYSQSHQHPINLRCHLVGIPLILLSLVLLPLNLLINNIWVSSIALFTIGWMLQFIGHYFEKKPPEFFKDWRFLLVGARWWFAKIRR